MRKKITLLALVLCFVFMFSSSSLALDPVPSGMTVLYTYTGVRDNLTQIAACVTCTYTGKRSTDVIVQFFDVDEDLWEASGSLPYNSGYTTQTFCSRSNAYYNDELSAYLTGDTIDQGFIRVAVDKREAGNVICDAVVLDSDNNPPNSICPLIGERSKKYKTSK